MRKTDAMIKILETYTETTQMPSMYIDGSTHSPILLSNDLDFTSISEYGDYEEISNFVDFMLREPAKNESIFNTVHTRNHFVYNIILIHHSATKKGALVSGPVLPFFPDEKLLDDIISRKSLPPYKRNKFKCFVRLLPLVSPSRVCQLGKLLLILSKSCESECNISCQVLFSKEKHSSDLLNKNLVIDTVPDIEYNEYFALYKLNNNLSKKIAEGDVNGIKDVLYQHASLYWDINPAVNNFRALKDKCIVICTVASVYSVQRNAQDDRILKILISFLVKLDKINTIADIVSHTALTLERFAYQVSTVNNEFSRHINRVLQYLKRNISENITLQKLSEHTGLNPIYLSSLIKKETNLSLSDHINLIRISEAKSMLVLTNKPIQDIAFSLGYSYQSHFSAVFKKFEGITPLEFRTNHYRKYSKN